LVVGICQLYLLDHDLLLRSRDIRRVTLTKLLRFAGPFLVEADPVGCEIRFALQFLHSLSRNQNLLFQVLESLSLLG
jgi:hypothetical protein